MNEYEYFLQLINSYIYDTSLKYNESIDWNKIYYISKIHSLIPIVFFAIKKLDKYPPNYDLFKKDFLMVVNLSVLQEINMEQIIKELNDNYLEHILMKGYILRNYYPDKEARTFGDIDFLINEMDREKCHYILLDLGFEYQEEKYNSYVMTYKKGPVYLEVHTDIIYEKLFNDFDYMNYFKEKVKNKQLIKGYTYELTKEDHFIFVLVHLAKHFYNAGVGIRMILDVVVFLKKFYGTMDMDYINNELKYIKLDKFANFVFFICKKYFNSIVECTPIEQDDSDKIINYIIKHGVFGFDDKNVQGVSAQRSGSKGIRLFIKKAFPDLLTMKRLYPWFKDGKKYMLPYAWFRRCFYFITNKAKRKSISSTVAAIFDNSDDIDKHIEMLKIVGLK